MRSTTATVSLHATLDSLVSQFVDDLEGLVLGSAREAVERALGGSSAASSSASRGRSSATRGPRSLGMPKGQKRDPAAIEALVEKLHAYVKKHPGERIETIAKGMGITTRELNLPVKKLIADRRVSTKGHKRATTYFPKG